MALAAGVLLLAQPVKAVTINSFQFAPAEADFGAGTIDFDLDSLFDDFTINSQDGGDGSLTGLSGEIGGTFTFSALGSITTTGGTFSIDDGDGDSLGSDDILVGILDFQAIGLFNAGVTQTITLNGALEFASPYTGTNADLISLAASSFPIAVATDFIFSGLTTFEDLFASGDASGTFQFALAEATAVPEPHALTFLGLGIFSIGVFGHRWKRRQLSGLKGLVRRCHSSRGHNQLAACAI